MKFEFIHSPAFPRLAWCLELEKGGNIAKVLHGEWVETSDQEFVEGGWAGDFGESGFYESFMTGTGAMLVADTVLFVSPSHTLDRLIVVRKGAFLYVSNSLPCILARTDEQLDPAFLFYDSYMASIRHGLDRYERSIFTRNGIPISIFYCCNLILRRDHELTEVAKKPTPPFENFHAYRGYMEETIRRIARNCADSRRIVRYAPLTTISRGYDSPVATVFARAVGCRTALTFRESRQTTGADDCGTNIAKSLGLSVLEFDRLGYRNMDGFPEARNSGGPSEFLSFGSSLSGSLLFTGFNGDMIWSKHSETVSTRLIRTDASGTSLTEFRLENGFCHLPVPFIGADSHPSIFAISNSREMANWSLGTSYDRPVARRIVEEAGIAREMFGQRKRAAGVVVTLEGLEATMSEHSLKDFETFLRDKWSLVREIESRCLRLIKKAVYHNERARKFSARVARSLGIPSARIPLLFPHRLTMLSFGYIGKESFLFHWGVEKLMGRFKAVAR